MIPPGEASTHPTAASERRCAPRASRPWVGSENQRFHFLTDRYDESIFSTPNRLELTIAPDGAIELNGFATTEVLEALLEGDRR